MALECRKRRPDDRTTAAASNCEKYAGEAPKLGASSRSRPFRQNPHLGSLLSGPKQAERFDALGQQLSGKWAPFAVASRRYSGPCYEASAALPKR